MKMNVASSPLSFIINSNSAMPMYNCTDCSYKTSSLRKLGRHKSVNHAGVKYRCEHCDFVTGYQSNYYRHRKQVHTNVMHNQAHKLQPNVTIVQQQSKPKPNNYHTAATVNHQQRFIPQTPAYGVVDRTIKFQTPPTTKPSPSNVKSSSMQLQQAKMASSQQSKIVLPSTQITTTSIVDNNEEWICSECGAEFRSKLRLDVHFNSCHVDDPVQKTNGKKMSPNGHEPPPTLVDYSKPKMTPSSVAISLPASSSANHLNGNFTSMINANDRKSSKTSVDEEQAILSAASIEYLTKSVVARKTIDVGGDMDEDGEGPLDLRKNDDDTPKTISPDIASRDFDGLYRCDLCPYTTSESVRYRKHVRCHQTTAPTKCEFCNFNTVYSWNLDRHVRCHKTTSRYTCRRCSFSQNTRQSMSFHLQHHHTLTVDHKSVQTDVSWLELESDSVEIDVDVGFEPFIFEKHAVVRNENVVANGNHFQTDTPPDFTENRRTPASSSTTSSSSKLQNESSVCSRDDDAVATTPTLIKNQLLMKSTTNVEENGKIVRKYLSERDAIELPSDKFTFEETNDPDIKNRFCSICGYQGKWISEMIRHKRVHTNERPFKCKYCDRTSKWKADLIRHVSKVHGIRVVSKYSRSHTFESDAKVVKALKQANKTDAADAADCVSDGSMMSDVVSDQGSIAERCDTAELEDDQKYMDGDEEFVEMVDDENLELQRQNFIFQQHQQHLSEFAQQLLLAHMATLASTSPGGIGIASALSLNGALALNGNIADHQTVSAMAELKDLRDVMGNKQMTSALEKYITVYQSSEGEPILKCRICPYETRDLHTFRAHTQKHENKKPYQCSSCGYRSNWSSDVHKHIRLKKTGHDRAFVIKLNENECSSSSYMVSPTATLESPIGPKLSPSSPNANGQQQPLTWRCVKCPYVHELRSELIDHLSKIHNSPPYACMFCNFSSLYRKTCIYHVQSQHNCGDSSMGVVENLTFECQQKISPPIKLEDDETNRIFSNTNGELNYFNRLNSSNGGTSSSPSSNHVVHHRPSRISPDDDNFVGPPPNVVVDKNKTLQPFKRAYFQQDELSPVPSKVARLSEDFIETKTSHDVDDDNECKICPFISSNVTEMMSHRKAHVRPKGGLMCYKCVFCEWYAKKKSLIVDHLKLHTSDPTPFMAEVERNLITPLVSRAADDVDDDNAANALRGLSGVEKKFKCNQCSFATNFSKNLDLHLICHNKKPTAAAVAAEDVLDLSNGNSKIIGQLHRPESFTAVKKSLDHQKSPFVGPTTSSNGNGLLHFKDVTDVMSDFNAFFKNEDDDEMNGEENRAFFRQLQSLTNGLNDAGLKQYLSTAAVMKQPAFNLSMIDPRNLTSENNNSFVGRNNSMNDDDNDGASDHDETVDPEAYIHAGEEGLGDEQLFAEMVPKDIQKVNAMVDGQMRKMWQCRYCSHVSKRRANIRMHEKKHFKPNAVGLLKCPKCSYRGDKRSLKIHYRTHVSVTDCSGYSQKFPCSYCPAIFRKPEVLDVHMAFHGGHNRYRCTQCSYAVPSQQQLSQHAQVHKNRSPNGVQAAKTISTDDNIDSTLMNARKRSNPIFSSTNESMTSNSVSPQTTTPKPKKHQCRFCPAKFTDRTQIQRHEHFHGINLKFKCHLCDYSVPFPINLSKHLKAHHGINLIGQNNESSSIDDDDAEENVTAQLESEAFDQYLHNPNGFVSPTPSSSSRGVTPTALNGLKMKINLGKLSTQSA